MVSDIRNTVRKYGQRIDDIPLDHVLRYLFAIETLAKYKVSHRVIDGACGCGYGSCLMWDAGYDVFGIDISDDAINWAEKYFTGPSYLRGSLDECTLPDCQAVVSLETLEHIPDPLSVLKRFREACGGILIASTPNEEKYPFSADRFKNDSYPHLRHYTPKEFDDLLSQAGWTVLERYSQAGKSKDEAQVRPGTDGRFLIYVAR